MPGHRDAGKGKAERAGGTPGMPGALKSKGGTEPEAYLLEEEHGGQAPATDPVKDGLEGGNWQ